MREERGLLHERNNVSLKVGDGAQPGKVLKVIGRGSLGREKHQVTLGAALQTVTFTVPVQKIKLKSASRADPVCLLVVDDLTF